MAQSRDGAMQAWRDACPQADHERIDGKTEAKLQRRESIQLLKDEGRRGDVGKEGEETGHRGERAQRETRIAKHPKEVGIDLQYTLADALRGWKRLGQARAAQHQYHTHHDKQTEHALPTGLTGHQSTDDGGGNGGDAVDGAEHGHKSRQLLAAIHIGGHTLGDDDAARTGQPLKQPAEVEEVDVGSQHAEHRGDGKHHHRPNKDAAPAKLVGERADKHLAGGQTDHARRQAERRQRGRGVKEGCQLGQHRKIKVSNKGTKSGQHSQGGRDKYTCFRFHCLFPKYITGFKICLFYPRTRR